MLVLSNVLEEEERETGRGRDEAFAALRYVEENLLTKLCTPDKGAGAESLGAGTSSGGVGGMEI